MPHVLSAHLAAVSATPRGGVSVVGGLAQAGYGYGYWFSTGVPAAMS